MNLEHRPIVTLKELMDMMFDLSYSVSGEDEPFKMKFNEVPSLHGQA